MEKYILKNNNGIITVSRDNDKVFLSLSLNPLDTKSNTFRYDGKYIDEDINMGYFVNVKVSTTDTKQTDVIKKSGIKIQTDSRVIKEYVSSSAIKFVGIKNNIRVEVKIPIKALTHKGIDNSTHVKRIGYIGPHDKHGNCGVTQIVSGGLVRPK